MKTMKITAVLLALTMLAGCSDYGPRTPNEPDVTKSTAAQELMSADDIMNIAIDHAKSSAEGAVAEELANGTVTDKNCEFTAKNGIPIYDCTFKIGKFEFEYEIDQQNGAIRSYVREFDENAMIAISYLPDIGGDAALDYALWYLDLKKADIENASTEYSEKWLNYVVKFTAGGFDYICFIDRYSGEFLRSNRDIGPKGAEEIAYNHAAQNAEGGDDFSNLMLAGMVTDQDTDAKGVPSERKYSVGFKIGGYEYEYEIDGLSGEILKIACDPDDDWSNDRVGGFDASAVSYEKPELPDYFADDTSPGSLTLSIDAEAAKVIALGQLGLSVEVDVSVDVQLVDGVYYVSFEANGYVYIFGIDSQSGRILLSDIETEEYAYTADVPETGERDTSGFIEENRAVDIAFEHAGMAAGGEAYGIGVELKYERGQYIFKVKFEIDGNKYEYDIDALTGNVLRAVKETVRFLLTSAAE